MHTLETTRRAPARPSWRRVAARWIVTFAGFPAGGFTAMLLVGPVDSVITALAGGLITGTILGAAQAWGLGRSGPGADPLGRRDRRRPDGRPRHRRHPVGFGTSLAALVVQGAICGLAVGTAQALALARRLGRIALAWPAGPGGHLGPRLGGHLRRGHRRSNEQFTVFGSSGAVAVTALTVILPGPAHSRPNAKKRAVMSRHVVFGTGQIGRLVAEKLVGLGADVTAGEPHRPRRRHRARGSSPATPPIRRSRPASAPAPTRSTSASTPRTTTTGPEEFPPMQRGVLAAAEAAGARLVVLDNLYAYGPSAAATWSSPCPPTRHRPRPPPGRR